LDLSPLNRQATGSQAGSDPAHRALRERDRGGGLPDAESVLTWYLAGWISGTGLPIRAHR